MSGADIEGKTKIKSLVNACFVNWLDIVRYLERLKQHYVVISSLCDVAPPSTSECIATVVSGGKPACSGISAKLMPSGNIANWVTA